MSTDNTSAPKPVTDSSTVSVAPSQQAQGLRKNGKNWHASKKAFRPTAGLTSFEKRRESDRQKQATKAHEQEMKDEKEAERNSRIQAIKDRRKAKEERERYEKMAEKMHQKRVERKKKREKRNKLLKS